MQAQDAVLRKASAYSPWRGLGTGCGSLHPNWLEGLTVLNCCVNNVA